MYIIIIGVRYFSEILKQVKGRCGDAVNAITITAKSFFFDLIANTQAVSIIIITWRKRNDNDNYNEKTSVPEEWPNLRATKSRSSDVFRNVFNEIVYKNIKKTAAGSAYEMGGGLTGLFPISPLG